MRPWRTNFVFIGALMWAAAASGGQSIGADSSSVSLSAIAGQTFAQCGANCTTTTNVTGANTITNTVVEVAALNFSAAASSTGGWLSVSPSQNTTSATLTINANPAGLPAGPYSGTITLTCDNGSSCTGTSTISVSFTVAAPPSLQADNNPIQFFASAGQTFAQCGSSCTATTDISSSDGVSALNFSAVASSGGGWLSVTPNQTTTPATLTVSVDPGGLQAGNYSGTITLACDQGSICTGLVINVSFNVSGVVLTAAPNPVNVTLMAGQSTTKSVTLTGGSSVSVSVTSGASFLQAPASANAPGTLQLTLDATHLSAGNYPGSLQLQCVNGSPCVPVTLAVSLTVTSPQSLNAGALSSSSFSATVGQNAGQCGSTCTATFSLAASTGSLSYQIVASSSGNWLGASPLTGTATTAATTITVTANASSLTANTYSGTLTINCVAPSSCAQQQISVSFTVAAVPTLSPGALSSSLSGGSGNTLAQCGSGCTTTFTLTASPSSLNYQIVPSSSGGWLGAAPLTGTAPTTGTTITVTANPATLTPGNYSGTLAISCTAPSSCSPIQVSVGFTVTGTVLTAAPNPATIPVTAGQTTSTTVTLTGLSGSTTATAAVVTGGSWLQAAVLSQSSLKLSVNAAGLTPGNLSGSVQLQCTGGSPCIPVTEGVNLTVTAAPGLTTGALMSALTGTAGQTPAQCGASCTTSFPLSTNSGSLNFQIVASSSGNWLGASPATGTASNTGTTINVTANPASLAAGTYMGMLTISCAAPSSCAPVQMNVGFAVSSAGAKATLVPSLSSVSFAAVTGRGNPPAQTVTLSSSDGTPLAYSVSGAPPWLTVSPLSGSTATGSGTLTLTPNAAAAPQPSGSGTLTITPSNGAAASTIAVSITFSPFSVSTNPSRLTIDVQAGATQTQTFSIGTVDGASATVALAVSGSTAVSVNSAPVTVPGNITVTANAAGLQAGSNPTATITISCTSANPCTAVAVPVQLSVTAGTAPLITPNGIVPLYSTTTTVQQGEWISLYGTNLANGTYNWKGDFPQSLGGTIVTIDGREGYLSFVSPTQINVQVPNDSATGTVPVQVVSPNGSTSSTVTLGEFGPALSLLGDNKHAAGLIIRTDGSGAYSYPGGTYDIIGPTGTSLGYRTVAAAAGDYIELYGVGFGPTTPSVPAGQPFAGQTSTNDTVTILINNVAVPLPLQYSGLSGAGLYQFNFILPAGLGTGDVPVQGMVGGISTQADVVIALQ
jgi:uncharacterized protein (TIGR03437 family)